MQSAADKKRASLARYILEVDTMIMYYRNLINSFIVNSETTSASIVIAVPPPQVVFPQRRTFPNTAYLMKCVVDKLRTTDGYVVDWTEQYPLTIKCSWPLALPIFGVVAHTDINANIKPPPPTMQQFAPDKHKPPPITVKTKKSTEEFTDEDILRLAQDLG